MDARAPVGERGDWAERHRRLRAGAEEAPEEQRDEQRGASGPHGGAPADVTAFSNGRLVTRKISQQKRTRWLSSFLGKSRGVAALGGDTLTHRTRHRHG